jgi:hypothetical protein
MEEMKILIVVWKAFCKIPVRAPTFFIQVLENKQRLKKDRIFC